MVVPRRMRRRTPASTTPLNHASGPNDVWSLGFRGHFRLGNGRYCYPLTVTDNYSRMLLGCHVLETTRAQDVRVCLEQVFTTHGLPRALRSDNGSPFASHGVLGMSALCTWWMTPGFPLPALHPRNHRRPRRTRGRSPRTRRRCLARPFPWPGPRALRGGRVRHLSPRVPSPRACPPMRGLQAFPNGAGGTHVPNLLCNPCSRLHRFRCPARFPEPPEIAWRRGPGSSSIPLATDPEVLDATIAPPAGAVVRLRAAGT